MTQHTPAVDSVSTPTTIPAAFEASVARHPDRPAIIDDLGAVSYAELAESVDVVSQALIASGIAPGDRVATLMPNGRRFIVLTLAVASAGAVLAPLNTRLSRQEIRQAIEVARPAMIFVCSGFVDRDYAADAASAADQVPDARPLIIETGTPRTPTSDWETFIAPRESTAGAGGPTHRAPVTPESPSDVLFTSGTSGPPRTIVATHGQTTYGFGQWADVVGLTSSDVQLVALPMFQGFGLKAGLVASIMRGAAVVPMERFSATEAVRLIEDHRVSVLAGSPTLHEEVIDAHRRLGSRATLRAAVVGTAFVPPALIDQLAPVCSDVITGYGLTECSGPISMNARGSSNDQIATTVGRPLPSLQLRIATGVGDGVAASHRDGEPRSGEVLVKGYCVMAQRSEPSADEATWVDADGWLHTGDLGILGADGLLRLVGRRKEMYIVGGFNVYPHEVDAVLQQHPAILEAAVAPVPDERLGEVGCAYVALRPNARATEHEILAWCADQLANYKVPRAVAFVEALPRTALGKVRRGDLRQAPVANRT